MTHRAKPIRILLVDAQHIVLWALERLIEGRKPKMEVVGRASNCAEAALLANQTQPDIVLLDLNLDDGRGVDIVASIAGKQSTRVVIYSAQRDLSAADRAVLSGARGLVRKEESTDTLLLAIEKVHAGELWLDRETTSRIFTEFTRPAGAAPVDSTDDMIVSLTRKERAIVNAFARNPGRPNKQISETLFISEHTLRNHLTSIYSKLNVTNRWGLSEFVRLNGHRLGPEVAIKKPQSPAQP